jgi:TolB-like protein/Tfp pilus assembly protein PilF
MTRQVFISHAAADRAAAEAIRAALEAQGLSCWIAPRDIPPGAEWAAAIMAGIAEVRVVVLVHSAASSASQMVLREVNVAVDSRTPVIPVRIDATPPQDAMQFYLGSTHWLDASAGPLHEQLPRIVAAVAEQLGPKSAPLTPPPAQAAPERPALTLPDKPSLVVLPFQNMSGDPEQEYFADGMVEDITTALSRIPSLFVISRNSAFTYKGRAVDVRQVGRELGVRYVLEGSVRKAGLRLRITGQLIDAMTGAHLWADRFDGGLDDVFDLQDRVTASVAGAIEPHLQRAEIERAQRKATQDLGAYDYFLRGMAIFHLANAERIAEAQVLFAQAFALDAGYGAAYGMAAACINFRKLVHLLDAAAAESAEGVALARLAAANGRDDPTALALAGQSLLYLGSDLDAGALLIERACELNPNSALAWARAGLVKMYLGDHATAIANFERAIRLSPVDPELYQTRTGMAASYFLAGRYDDAVACAERALSEQPNFLAARRILAAAFALSGRLDAARRAMAEFVRARPQVRLSNFADWLGPWRRPEDIERYAAAYRLAGLPE